MCTFSCCRGQVTYLDHCYFVLLNVLLSLYFRRHFEKNKSPIILEIDCDIDILSQLMYGVSEWSQKKEIRLLFKESFYSVLFYTRLCYSPSMILKWGRFLIEVEPTKFGSLGFAKLYAHFCLWHNICINIFLDQIVLLVSPSTSSGVILPEFESGFTTYCTYS